MLVLVSFVLVLAAAVTLVVGLLQSGLTLIYLSIACSVLAGVVLAIAVLRGRPEPSVAAAPRAFTPPPPREPVPASVGAPSAQPTTSWSAPTTDMPTSPPPSSTPPPSPPPPPSPTPAPTDDAATKAAGTALLGRLRSRRGQQEQEDAGVAAAPPVATSEPEPEPVAAPEPELVPSDMTMEMPVVSAGREADDGFPIADYDRLRATELLSRLPELDRNQLEAVRDREMAGKNRFTILSRVDALLAAQEAPAWEVADDEWEAEEADAGTGGEAIVLDAEPLEIDEFETVDDEEAEEWEAAGSIEDDEVDELVSPADEFPIAGYESLTVGQILPRLSDLDADQLAQVRAREAQGRARGTILDRIDRLAAKSGAGAGAMAMPPAAAPPRRAAARKTAAAPKKAPAVAAKKRGRAATPVPAADITPIPAPPATPARAPRKAVKKATTAAVAPAKKAAPPARKTSTRGKKAAPVIPTETAAPVKKARKSTKKL